MTDSIEARLAAVKSIQGLLLDADWTLAELTGALSHDGLAIGLAADLALAAAVRRLDSDNWGIVYDKGKFYVSNGDGQYSAGESTPTAAIQAAKEASDD